MGYISSMWQRLGFLPRTFKQTVPGAIWLHAVSVGEVLASVELLRHLRSEFPRVPLFVSVTTLSGHALALKALSPIASGIFYAPIDFVFSVRRVLRTLQPAVVIVMETEIWPNLFREVKRTGCGLVLANGRISDRAAPCYLALRSFFRFVLQWPDNILAQSEAMRERFTQIGAPSEKVSTTGNLKYDARPAEADPHSPVRTFLGRIRPAGIWIAASTMPGATAADVDEDDVVIDAFRQLRLKRPGLLLILAPRKPERFHLAAQKLQQAAIPFLRRSALNNSDNLLLPGVLLLDSIGDLSGLFPVADVVFMGGSLASRGGHNLLEPAFFARPVVVGPHMENFPDISADFRALQACVEIQSSSELANAVGGLLDDPEQAAKIGKRAAMAADAKGGATKRTVTAIRRIYLDSLPCFLPSWPMWLLLWPLSRIWRWAGRRRTLRDLAHRRRLDANVISIGNLTVGGTGKTPFVLHLAERIKSTGRAPGILTRGYGRHSPERYLVLKPGACVPVVHSGDEPQIFLRSGLAPVGIGSDRFEAGRLLLKQFSADILLLDDGFQHLRLERQIDIVLIDALNPFGGCEILPLGRLREPIAALGRADVVVITRSDFGLRLTGLEREIRKHNSAAPIFYSRFTAECWREHETNHCFGPKELPFTRVGAFCGLGNPQSFWHMLSSLGLNLVDRLEFADHHSYRPHEVRRLAQQFQIAGAEAVLTTEKDIINICEDCDKLLAPLRLYWLQIRTEIDREEEFWREIGLRLV